MTINKKNEDLQAVKEQTNAINKAAADKLAKQKEAARIALLAKQNPKKAAKKIEQANQEKKAKAGKAAEPTKAEKQLKNLTAKNAKLTTRNASLKAENKRLKADIQEVEENLPAGLQQAANEIAAANGQVAQPISVPPPTVNQEK